MFASKDIFLKSSGGGYQISRSVRLRSSASAYLNRTMTASFTSKRIFTFSFWCKRGTLSTAQSIFDRNQSTNVNQFAIGFNTDNTFQMAARTSGTSTVSLNLTTSAVFRDPSAWYHMVIAVDNTQATLANRGQIYVNGVLQTLGTQTATQNVDYHLLTGLTYDIGRTALTASQYFDGYLTEFNFIDGQQLTPSSFGETNAVTGVWQPKKYGGTYGTNGFYLNFSDNSGATATTIGKDYSGNGNNWTPNNISVTAGVTYDSMTDVPTMYADGGNGRGNYCTLNPLTAWRSTKPTNGNMEFASGSAAFALGTMLLPSGKWYCEVKILGGTNEHNIGFVNLSSALTSSFPATTTIRGSNAFALYTFDGKFYDNGTASAALATFATNDIVMLGYDADNSKIYVGRNGTWLNSAVPASGTGAVSTTATAPLVVAAQYDSGAATGQQWNFGQRPFSYTPPSGFRALNTQNLPAPTISNGASYMAATLYTGNGATGQSVVNTLNGVSFAPDFVWVKVRSVGATSHYLADTVRGATKYLQSDTTAAEGTNNGITAFNSNGFSVGAIGDTNSNAASIVGWQWNAGGSTVTNTDGSISSQVRANPTAGFSVVTYTGTGNNLTVGHGLGVAPSMVIFKNRGASAYWAVYHSALGSSKKIYLNDTQAPDTATNWCVPNSTTLAINDSSNNVNAVSNTYVAYVFSAVAGYSAFGSYTGNGSADGTFVYLGFRPRFVLFKRTDVANDWVIHDSSRNTYNIVDDFLKPNLSNAEGAYATSGHGVDFLSSGFKLKTDSAQINANTGTYIYMAFAENPFKLSLAR